MDAEVEVGFGEGGSAGSGGVSVSTSIDLDAIWDNGEGLEAAEAASNGAAWGGDSAFDDEAVADEGAWWAGLEDDEVGGAGSVAAGGSVSVKKKADKGSGQAVPRRWKRPKRPIVAILGRPNVGKSMLANRISGAHHRGAIVHDEVGVTRDRTYLTSEWGGKVFDVVDTGGLVFDDDESSLFLDQIRQQAAIALTEACVAVLVVDGQAGLNDLDDQIARFLRKEWLKQLPVFVAVNKCESTTSGDTQTAEFYKLGLGDPMPVSGIHGTGVAELLDEIKEHLYDADESDEDEAKEDFVNIAIVGRPNVGKSSLFNKLFGESRAIVSDVAGTTRDTLDAELVKTQEDGSERVYRFIDTAGIRRKGKVQYGSEFFMVNRALKAIRRSDVVLLVLDATIGISDQDRTLAEQISRDGRACVVLLNKWDAVADKDDKTYLKSIDYVRDMLPAVRWAPVVLVSALTGQRCPKIYDAIDEAIASHRRKVSTSALNDVLRDAVLWQAPPPAKGGIGKIYYCSQIGVSPPTVAMFCNKPSLFGDNYKRFLDRKFREGLGFQGTPIKLVWRGKKLRSLDRDKKRKG